MPMCRCQVLYQTIRVGGQDKERKQLHINHSPQRPHVTNSVNFLNPFYLLTSLNMRINGFITSQETPLT
jgi:hypothetical protein